MNPLQEIFDAIAAEGFSARVVVLIDNYINDILYGKTSFPRFNLSEHAGLSKGGAHATREQAIRQVEMLQEAKEAWAIGK